MGNVTYAFAAEQVGVMPFGEGSTLTVQGREFSLADVAQVYVDDSAVDDNTVAVVFEGSTASVLVAGNVAQYVEVTVDGANVSVAQSALVSDDTCGEIKYTLSGHIYITGGTVMAFGGRSPECGLDANSEQGYTVFFTGGTLLAVGGGNSVPTTSASTQAFVSTSLSVTANAVVTIKSGTTELASFTVPAEYGSALTAIAGPAAVPAAVPAVQAPAAWSSPARRSPRAAPTQ